MAAGDPCCVLSPHLILSDPGLVPPPRMCWIPTATCHLSCRQPCLISCLLSRNALSTWEGHAAPPSPHGLSSPRDNVTCADRSPFVLPLCREVSRFSSLALAPRSPLLAEGQQSKAQGGEGTHLADRPLSSLTHGCQLYSPTAPGPGRISLQLPSSTSRHVLKPKLTGMNVWLPPLSSTPPAWAHPMPMSPVLQDTWDPTPHSRQVPSSPAQASPPTFCRSCQTPDFQGDPWPTQASLYPVPIFPWLPPVPHASLVTPRLPRFPSFPRTPPSHPTHHPLPHPARRP